MQEDKKYTFLIIMIGLILVVLPACNESDPLEEAWAKFEEGDYDGAYTAFSDIGDDPEAYTGLGWTVLKMDSIDPADRFFQLAESISGTDTVADVYSGWMAASWVKGQYQKTIEKADIVLRHDPDYVFSHNDKITKSDIELHKAFSYFYLGDYTKCNAAIASIKTGWVPTNDENSLLTTLESLFEEYK